MFSFLLTAVIMFAFWFLLSGQTSPILLIFGVVSSLFVAYSSHDLLIGKDRNIDLRRGVRFLAYLPWLFWQIILSNILLVKLVLNPKMALDPSVIRIKHGLKTDLGIVLLANSITLTPGTLTIEATREELLVHAINKQVADDLLAGEMQARVRAVEGQAKEMKQHV